MPSNNKMPEFSVIAKKVKANAARMAANEAQKFFKDCFVKGGFTDTAFQAWRDRTGPLGGKKLMYGKGVLMQSIRPTEQTEERVVISSDTAYSEIHNNGGIIIVTERMKKFWWAKYYEFTGKVKKTAGGKISKSAANKTINSKSEFCKGMALIKVGTKIKIPARQYIGESAVLMKQFDEWLKKYIETEFKTE